MSSWDGAWTRLAPRNVTLGGLMRPDPQHLLEAGTLGLEEPGAGQARHDEDGPPRPRLALRMRITHARQHKAESGLRASVGWTRLARAPAAPIAAGGVGLGLGRLPAPGASAVLCRRVGWVPCAGHSTPRAQVGRRPVAAHGCAQGFRHPPPSLPIPASPRAALLQSGSARGSLGATGGREPVASACTVMVIGTCGVRLAIGRFAAMREDQPAGGLGELPSSRST